MGSADRIDSLRECRNNFPPQANANAGRRRMAPTSAPRRSASDNCARNYPYSTIDLCLCVCVCVCVSTTAEDRERERRHETQSEASFIFGFFWLPFSFRRRRQRRWWLVFSFIGGDNHRRRRVGSTTRRQGRRRRMPAIFHRMLGILSTDSTGRASNKSEPCQHPAARNQSEQRQQKNKQPSDKKKTTARSETRCKKKFDIYFKIKSCRSARCPSAITAGHQDEKNALSLSLSLSLSLRISCVFQSTERLADQDTSVVYCCPMASRSTSIPSFVEPKKKNSNNTQTNTANEKCLPSRHDGVELKNKKSKKKKKKSKCSFSDGGTPKRNAIQDSNAATEISIHYANEVGCICMERDRPTDGLPNGAWEIRRSPIVSDFI